MSFLRLELLLVIVLPDEFTAVSSGLFADLNQHVMLYCRSLPLPLLSLPCLSVVLVCAPLYSFLKSFDGGFIDE